MKPIRIPARNSEQLAALEELYRTTRDAAQEDAGNNYPTQRVLSL